MGHELIFLKGGRSTFRLLSSVSFFIYRTFPQRGRFSLFVSSLSRDGDKVAKKVTLAFKLFFPLFSVSLARVLRPRATQRCALEGTRAFAKTSPAGGAGSLTPRVSPAALG